MRKILTSLFMVAAWLSFAQTGNVGVNTTTPDAVLEVYSTTKGVLVPRLTIAQRDAMVSPLNPANKVQEGTIIYNLDRHCLQYNVAPTGTAPNWVGYGCASSIMFSKVTKYNGVSVINNQGIGYNGEAIPASSTIEIEVNVTDATPYSFTATDATTGLTYSASGNFTTSGTKLVTLINNGTSIAWDKYGTINMTLTGANNTLALAPRIDIKSIPTTHTDWTYNDVTYGTQTWMDRNLGARRVATAINDVLSYGNHYQWGRPADGHEITVWNGDTPTSGRGFADATALEALATSDAPGNANFILTNVSPFDWRDDNNNNRWATANQGPCPTGYHVPTSAEWDTADTYGVWNNNTDTFNSALKLPAAGHCERINGLLYNQGTNGYYWSSTVGGTTARALHFYSTAAGTYNSTRANAFTVRCLKN